MQTQMVVFLGLVLLGGGQPADDRSPSDAPAPVAQQTEPAEAPSCCAPCDHCCHHGRCGHESVCRWMIREMCLGPLFHGDCNMVPHTAYFPELHGYYYFRPYHYSHIRQHQEFVSSFGEDPRAPYANTIFQQVYKQMTAKGSGSAAPQRLPFPAAKAKAKEDRSVQKSTRAVVKRVSHRRVVSRPANRPSRKPVLSRRK